MRCLQQPALRRRFQLMTRLPLRTAHRSNERFWATIGGCIADSPGASIVATIIDTAAMAATIDTTDMVATADIALGVYVPPISTAGGIGTGAAVTSTITTEWLAWRWQLRASRCHRHSRT